MKKLNIDMNAILEALQLDDDEMGKSYLDSDNGEVIYIPMDVSRDLENGNLQEDYPDWMKDSVEYALMIEEDINNRFLSIPQLESEYIYKCMIKYTYEFIKNENLKDKLIKALNGSKPMRKFKQILMDEDDVDKWYDQEEIYILEYIKNWLELNEIIA